MDKQNPFSPDGEDHSLDGTQIFPIVGGDKPEADSGTDDFSLEQIIQETQADDFMDSPADEPAEAEPEQPAEVPHQEIPEIDDTIRQILSEGSMPQLTPDPLPEESYEEPYEEPEGEEPERKRRPKRKSRYGLLGIPHILVTLIWAAIILVVGVTLGRIMWLCAADVLAFGRGDQEITFTVSGTDTLDDISENLKDKGLIHYPKLFKFYVDFANKEDQISAGTFTLNTHMDYMALVNFMNYYSDSREVVEVVIPEGYTCAEIFSLLEENGVCKASDLEQWAKTGELSEYWFLKGVKRGTANCLEGFLFPDTYEFYTDDEPQRVLEKFLDNFEYRFDDKLQEGIEELNARLSETLSENGYDEEYIADHQLTVYEIVTVASMIEKETANTLESYTIASVIFNRLYDWGDTPSFLNIDAAIIYALGEHKEQLTAEDLKIDSPYNTYLHTGLTPGAICNPGLSSLNAALDPDDTDYYYYAMDPSTGSHHFSESEEGHNEFLNSLEEESEDDE